MAVLFLCYGVLFIVLIYLYMAFFWLIAWVLGYIFDLYTFDEYWLIGSIRNILYYIYSVPAYVINMFWHIMYIILEFSIWNIFPYLLNLIMILLFLYKLNEIIKEIIKVQ